MRTRCFVAVALVGVGCSEETHHHPDAAPVGWHDAAVIAELAAASNEQLGPALSADGLELFFQSNRSGASGCSDLWHAKRPSTTMPFGTPMPLDGVNTTMCEGGPTLRADGLELLFHRDNNSAPSTIWRTMRPTAADPFGTPTEVTELNIGTSQLFPSMSADGLTVVFQSASAPSGNMPVFQAERATITTPWNTPHQLNELAMPQPGVGLGSDALTAIAYSSGTERLVTYSRASATDAFGSTPTPISELTPNPQFKSLATPVISADGKEIFYARRNMGNHVEIWRAIRD